MAGNNEWIEKQVAKMLADLRASGFWESGINEAISLRSEHGYVWDVALKISCNYWCSYTLHGYEPPPPSPRERNQADEQENHSNDRQGRRLGWRRRVD